MIVVGTSDTRGSDQTAHNQETYDRIAPAYLEQQLRHRSGGKEVTEALQRSFLDAVPAGGVIADIGCGPALDAAAFAARGLRAVAMDRSRGMLGLVPPPLGGRVAQADLRMMPFAPGSLDGIWCCAALLHVPEEHTSVVIRECRRTLHAGGRLALVTAVGTGSRFEPVEYEPRERRWFVYRDPEEVRRCLRDLDFRIDLEERIAGNRDWLTTLCTAG